MSNNNLVYLTSRLDISSVKQYLYTVGKTDALYIDCVDDLITEVLLDPTYDIVVFDYKMDLALIDTLRTLEGKYNSIQVFASSTKIGQAYISITENISILPKNINLMVYLWENPAFSLGNMLNAEDAKTDVFTIENFASIDTEQDLLKFQTQITDMGDSDMASIKMLKVTKGDICEEAALTGEETIDSEYILAQTTQSLRGLIHRNKPIITDAVDEVLGIVAATVDEKEETTENIEPVVEETTENIEPVVEETTENIEPVVEETTEPVTGETVEETTEPVVKETTEPDIGEIIDSSTESYPEVIEEIQNIYEEYDETKHSTYDEIIEVAKAITADTDITPDYISHLDDALGNVNDTGIVDKSDNSGIISGYSINTEDMVLYVPEKESTVLDKEEIPEEKSDTETEGKTEPHILKGIKTNQPQTQDVVKHVGIKTVSSDVSVDSVKRGTLAGLRKRTIRTYRNPYEYFKEKGFDIHNLDDVYDYVQKENLKGSNLLLEEELYSRGLIDDDSFIMFMKEYLHRQVLTLDELMQSDVILDTWDMDTCKQLRILELPNKQDGGKCVVIGHKAKAIQNSLLTKFEKLELYVTLDDYIDKRLTVS